MHIMFKCGDCSGQSEGINMENKEYINESINYLKDNRTTPEYDAMIKHLEEVSQILIKIKYGKKIKGGINLENKDYINEIISYLKDDSPAHANASIRKYMEHLGYTKNEIEERTINIPELLNEKDVKITKLQRKLDEKEKYIQEVLDARRDTKVIYYIGLLTGIVGIGIGFLVNNILYVFSGLAILIIAINGLYEARKNKW